MSRAIKFRAICQESGVDKGKLIYSDSCGEYGDQLKNFFSHIESGSLDRETLQQYTGLKDKNGKEIFEGDIISVFIRLSCKQFYKEVKWLGGGFAISPPNEHFSYEVVGNILQNPEYLKCE